MPQNYDYRNSIIHFQNIIIMNKFADWFDSHFREASFAVLIAAIVFVMCCGADINPVNGSIYGTLGQILLTVVFCAGVVMLGQNAFSSQRIVGLKLFTAAYLLLVFGWLLAYSCHVQQVFAATDAIKLGCCGVLGAVACGWYLDWREEKLKKLEFLKDNRPDEYLRELIKNKRSLDSEQQLKVFYLADAEQLLFKYMQYEDIAESTEIRLLEEPFALNLIKHLPRYSFTDKGDARMFVVENAPELVLQYVENGNVFSPANELKMFDLPNAYDVLNAYVYNSSLSDEGEMRLVDLPDAEELVEYYNEEYGLCEAAWKKAEEKGWV